MKKYSFIHSFIFLSLISVTAFSQTVEVECISTNCFRVEPEATYSYEAVVKNLPNGYTIKANETQWSASDNNFDTYGTPDGQLTSNIRWKNRTNSAQKWVKVSVRIGRPGMDDLIIENQKTVVIKYLSPITQMTISGATPSSPEDGGITTLPCGAQTVNVSVNSLTADPPATINYTWSFPSGWTGATTTTTPNNTPYSNAGQNDGSIYVRAQRSDSDGSFFQDYIVTVKRPRVESVTISPSGIPTLCSNSQTVNLTANANLATSYSWTASGGAIIQSGQSSQTAVVKAASNGSVTVTANNACQSPKSTNRQIFFGTPTIQSNTVNGAPSQSINFINNPAFLVTTSNFPGVSYSWSIIDGTGSIYPSGNTCTVYAYPFVRVQVQTQNTCGNGQTYTYYLYESGSTYSITSPNPMEDRLNIEFKDSELANKYLESITLSSTSQVGIKTFNGRKAGTKKYFDQNKEVRFDVWDLRPGVYYLTVQLAGKKFSETLLKN